MINLGILGSGSGSNLAAILDAISSGRLDASVRIVLSDNPDAYILERARRSGIPSAIIDCGNHPLKFPLASQARVACQLLEAGVELVCLAGFMRLVKRPLLDAFPERILNIHPSLLPRFPGLEAWKQAWSAGVSESGATVHIVDDGMDTGPILAQETIPRFPEDTAETLHARIQEAEHRIYPQTIQNYAVRISL